MAKKSGLCPNDILEVSFYRLYDSKIFVWTIRTDNKMERQAAKQNYKGRTALRRTTPCRTKIVNAKTGEIISKD